MKKSLFLFLLFISELSIAGLISSRTTDLEQLDIFLAEITERSAILITDSFHIYSERQWIDDELTNVRSLMQRYRVSSERDRSSTIQEWEKLKIQLENLDIQNQENTNKFFKEGLYTFLDNFSSYVSKNDLEPEAIENNVYRFWRDEGIEPLLEKARSNQNVDLNEAGRIKQLLLVDISSSIEKFYKDAEIALDEKDKEYKILAKN